MSIASGIRLVGLLGVSLHDDRVDEVLRGLGAERSAFTPDERSDVTSREHAGWLGSRPAPADLPVHLSAR